MLTNTLAMRRNIDAVENGLYGLGGLFGRGALRHLLGGIFVRACFSLMSEHRGTSKDVLRPLSQSANLRCLALHLGGWKRDFYKQNRGLVMQHACQSIGASAPVLSIVQNTVTALSTDVANYFDKLHKNVIRDVERLISEIKNRPQVFDFSSKLNFEPLEINLPSNLGNGSFIKSKAYRMTRDGFTLLVMGWTGEKALQFKLAWLDAFNRMEEELRAQQQVPTLPPASPLGKSVAPSFSVAISDAMGHNAPGFDSPKHEAQGAKKSSGAIFMRNGSPMGETDGASSDAPFPCARSVNPSVSPTRLTAGGGSYNLHKEPIMQTNVGSIQPVRINFNDLTLRVFNINNEPWFAATDICAGLELTNPSKAISNLRACERSNLKLDRGGSLNIINESGLYTLILRCDAALKEGTAAFNFRVKVTDEILPSIRKNGSYNSVPTLPPASPLGKSVAPSIAATPMTREQLEAVRAQVQERFPDNKDALRAFSILQHHFRVVSYRQIPQARFEEVMEFAGHFVLPQLKPKKPRALPALCSSALSAKGDVVLPHVAKDHMAAHYAIVIHDGEPTMYELGKKWKLTPINNFEWTKAYCETEMPSELIPGLMNTLVRRMQQEAKK